jgi:hypothetical protein
MSSTSIFDHITKSDFLFGYVPQLHVGREKRFKSTIGGLLCYAYLTCLLVYAIVQALEYASDNVVGVMTENSRNITNFYPGREAGFNMAFGFPGKNLSEDIGTW